MSRLRYYIWLFTLYSIRLYAYPIFPKLCGNLTPVSYAIRLPGGGSPPPHPRPYMDGYAVSLLYTDNHWGISAVRLMNR